MDEASSPVAEAKADDSEEPMEPASAVMEARRDERSSGRSVTISSTLVLISLTWEETPLKKVLTSPMASLTLSPTSSIASPMSSMMSWPYRIVRI